MSAKEAFCNATKFGWC